VLGVSGFEKGKKVVVAAKNHDGQEGELGRNKRLGVILCTYGSYTLKKKENIGSITPYYF